MNCQHINCRVYEHQILIIGKDLNCQSSLNLVLAAVILSGLGLLLPVVLFFLTNDFFGKLFFTSCFLFDRH